MFTIGHDPSIYSGVALNRLKASVQAMLGECEDIDEVGVALTCHYAVASFQQYIEQPLQATLALLVHPLLLCLQRALPSTP